MSRSGVLVAVFFMQLCYQRLRSTMQQGPEGGLYVWLLMQASRLAKPAPEYRE